MAQLNEKLVNGGLLWLRILMGFGIGFHGFGKIFGGKIQLFAEQIAGMGFQSPEFFAWAAALSEFVGGCLIMIGLLTRLAAFFVFVTMAVAFYSFWPVEDPFGYQELSFAYGTMAGCLLFTGAGRFSVDGLFKK